MGDSGLPAPAVVVTGASSGIGEACALDLAARGWRVFAGVRDAVDAARLREQAPERIHPLQLDVTRADQVEAAVPRVADLLAGGRLAGLVNNAGVAIGGPLEHLPLEGFRHSLDVNVYGTVAMTQAFLPLLRKGRGRIVNMGSISSRIALPFIAPYAASKHALAALSESLRVELAPWGIHVALIEPGNVSTPIWTKSLARAQAERAAMSARAEQQYGPVLDALGERVGQVIRIRPEQVAARVWHALSASRPRARYPIGRALYLMPWLDRLPWRWRDRIILSALPAWGESP